MLHAADLTPAGPSAAAALSVRHIRERTGDSTQFASVRRILLEDGPERGVRALAFSTGGGLDFWVMVDRSLDVGPLWWRGLPVAWQGPNGFRAPGLHEPESEDGQGFMRSFGGLLVTCGLDRIRQPVNGRPLHGRLPFTPGRLLAYGEDWNRETPALFCEGEVIQARLDGENLRLRRRIEAPIGGNRLMISDRVVNDAHVPWPQALLYHINIGYPFLTADTKVHLDGSEISRMGEPDHSCGPAVRCWPARTGRGLCEAITPGQGRLALAFDTEALPWFQLWRDPRPGTYALGIEPCTSERQPDGTSGPERELAPGAVRSYRMELSFRDG